jgi:hypothetical protein
MKIIINGKTVEQILSECLQGRVPDELASLYNAPYRQNVDWSQFPVWASPIGIWDDCGHEG